jgi:hypothetical protein
MVYSFDESLSRDCAVLPQVADGSRVTGTYIINDGVLSANLQLIAHEKEIPRLPVCLHQQASS